SWVAKTAEGSTISASYRLISRDSALVETYVTQSGRETITVYHPDLDSLMLTHYCAQGNQARLRVTEASADRIVFRQIDVTNFGSDQGVMTELTIRFSGDAFDQTSTYRGPKGETDTTVLHFTRAPSTGSAEDEREHER